MAKRWEEMTQAEKIEDLRKDMLTTMAAVNKNQRAADQDAADLLAKYNAVFSLASQVGGAVTKLEKQVEKLEQPPQSPPV